MEQVQSPLVIFGPEDRLTQYCGDTYLRVPFSLDLVRIQITKLQFQETLPYWVVFDLPEETKYQGVFLKFLEEYRGRVAFYSLNSVELLPPFASRILSVVRYSTLYRFSFGAGISMEKKPNIHYSATPLVFRKMYEADGRVSNFQQRVLKILDSLNG